MAVERTLVLIKPDAMERKLAGEILARLERRGLDLRAARLVHVERDHAETHYAEHAEKQRTGETVFPPLAPFFTADALPAGWLQRAEPASADWC